MNFEDIMRKPHYAGIIDATDLFDRGNGLRPMHYRYLLIQNHGIDESFLPELKAFFKKTEIEKGNDLNYRLFFSNNPKGCVRSKTSLSNFLRKLVHEFNILKVGNKKYQLNKYMFSKQGKMKKRWYEINRLTRWFDEEELEEITNKIYEHIHGKSYERLNELIKKMCYETGIFK